MNLKADNFYSFKDFSINFSYPKKLVNTTIEHEYLTARPSFRYKKVNILMGANASGKTTFGRLLMLIFNLIDKKAPFQELFDAVFDSSSSASVEMDFIISSPILYRLNMEITPSGGADRNMRICMRKTAIKSTDDYEKCAARLDTEPLEWNGNPNDAFKGISEAGLSWIFSFPAQDQQLNSSSADGNVYRKVLENVLKTLDPSIRGVEKLDGIKDSYVIWLKDRKIIMQEGKIALKGLLSSGTLSGIDIATMIALIIQHECCLFYCDERFSFINSDIEQAIISLMIEKLSDDSQLFITTHNCDILDMNLPKHAFTFFKKDGDGRISAVYASDYLKKNTDSIRNAVMNDVFSTAPRLDLIDELASLGST